MIVESIDPNGPHGAKEAGEGPLHPVIPAISNAIHDAIGIRLTHLPFHPGMLLKKLREKRTPLPVAPPGAQVAANARC
jgi:CO/xanthine dehydrogenase Mo-binding subunit